MNENTDPDYGIGFRKMKSMLDKIGWKRLLKKLPRLQGKKRKRDIKNLSLIHI